MQVTVSLKNAPSGANKWQMSVVDWNVTEILSWGLDAHDNIGETATFEIPANWELPLRIDLTASYHWQEADGWHARQLYRFQSIWSDRTAYKEIFIPDFGSYYYNVSTEQFEEEEVRVGPYTQIIGATYPGEAQEGELVTIGVTVKNISTTTQRIFLTAAVVQGVRINFSPDEATVSPGRTFTSSGSFTMPNRDVLIYIWSLIWSGLYNAWVPDDEWGLEIALKGVPPEEEPPPEVPEYKGTLSRKELEYDEARADIPAYNIPQNQRGLVHIWGRNDTLDTQRMGISWIVRDPDGLVVEEYSAWEAWPHTGGGSEHQFIGGRFNLDKVGTYLLSVGLYMNPAAPEEVDSYYGALCTVVAAVPESEFRGFALSGYNKQ
ncbi:hypothetical protein ES703_08351 [subsurface metagenome]